MEYRLAGIDDIEDVFYIVKAAIVQMETSGIHQQDDIYPTKEDFISLFIQLMIMGKWQQFMLLVMSRMTRTTQ